MDFSALTDYLDGLPREWGIPQCALVVHRDRDTVYERLVNGNREDVYWLYSATKLTLPPAAPPGTTSSF